MEPLKLEHLPLATLALILQRIAAGYGERGVDRVDLSQRDLYRVFGTDEMFDIHAAAPSPIGIGSLHDDIAELSKLLSNRDRLPTAVDIERLGNVLRAVSEMI